MPHNYVYCLWFKPGVMEFFCTPVMRKIASDALNCVYAK